MTSNRFPEIPVEIVNIVKPRLYEAYEVAEVYAIELNNNNITCPIWSGNKDEKARIRGNELFKQMVDAGLKVSMIGWTREDGGTNYGHEPAVNYALVAVLVKLTPDAEKCLGHGM